MCTPRCVFPYDIVNCEAVGTCTCSTTCKEVSEAQLLVPHESSEGVVPGVYDCKSFTKTSANIIDVNVTAFENEKLTYLLRYDANNDRIYREQLQETPSGLYFDEKTKTWVNSCPSDRKYVELNRTCTARCQLGAYYTSKTSAGEEVFFCAIPRCRKSTAPYYLSDGNCAASCPRFVNEMNECVASCPSGAFSYDAATNKVWRCAENRCQNGHYDQATNSCVD